MLHEQAHVTLNTRRSFDRAREAASMSHCEFLCLLKEAFLTLESGVVRLTIVIGELEIVAAIFRFLVEL